MTAAVAMPSECCEAALSAMAGADPDLDPVWGLLVGAGEADSDSDSHDVADVAVSDPIVASALEGVASMPEESCQGDFYAYELLSFGAPFRATPGKPISNVVDKAEVSSQQFPLLDAATTVQPTRWDVPGCDAFVIDGVLSQEECDRLIAQADGLWSFWDDTDKPRTEFRNAHTVEVTHNELADRMWQRIGHLVNPNVVIREGDERCEVDIEGEWKAYAMNPKKLLARYLNGGHFSPHTDGTTVVDFNRRTFYSCVLFLNTSPWGGHTKIYSDEQIRKELVLDEEGRLTGDPALVLDAIPPAPGRMLVFYHRLMHEGVPAAEKYIIRTDVLYHRSPELCTSPRDVEAFRMYEEAQLLAEQGHCDASVSLYRRAFKLSPALAAIYKM